MSGSWGPTNMKEKEFLLWSKSMFPARAYRGLFNGETLAASSDIRVAHV